MKDEYKLFNKISINHKNHKEYNLSITEKENLFNKLVKDIDNEEKIEKKAYKKVAIASILCLSIITVSLSNERVLALVENIGKQIESYLGKGEDEYRGYKEQINKVSEDKGIKLSLYEVLLDDGEILLSMNIDSSNFDESKLESGLFKRKIYYVSDATVYMDDKKFVKTGGISMSEDKKDDKQDFLAKLDLTKLDTNNDGNPEIADYQIIENIDSNKDYNIKVVFNEVGVQKMGFIPGIGRHKFEFIQGNWEFEFKVNSKNLLGDTKVYDINKEIEIEDKDFKALVNLKQLRVSPISIKLTYATKMGKEYEFEDRNLNMELIDQDGNYINIGGGGGGNKEQTYMEWKYEGNLDNADKLESITILPYQYYREKGSPNPKYHQRIEYNDNSITIDLK